MPLVLTPLDDALTERLLETARVDATPEEVMPPVDGEPGWTRARETFFRAFHQERQAGLTGPHRTVMYAIMINDQPRGMIRLTLDADGATAETGMWLARSARGQGLGTRALHALLAEAGKAGARAVRADTTPANRAAQAVLRRAGATLEPQGDKVYARLELGT
ncbi:GNAT family protein [Asanoa sp. WMMD1127]|uniref:GNAT family N-acetyltransferase n=1 Tax=Asanoa sp. WMMD1127 TaxID=3016107 RepID=UPI002416986B|nr:GNAT family protein [Asanoa sp. WMMD1127]MDG4827008.1 GNAT family protein [Asanoa sp. WMMD1127]